MRFCKENHAIDEGEGTGTIIGTEPDNKMKYREERENTFNESVHWKRNLFDLPKGAPGKAFINELTKKINEWCSKSSNRDICVKALMVMPSLILQRTSNKCKMSEIKSHVERRLNHWKNKDVNNKCWLSEKNVRLELKVRMDLQDWMPISGVKSSVIQPLATHQMISVTL